jgi:uncharacterized protein YqgV (UPF0045/DUF77 family)
VQAVKELFVHIDDGTTHITLESTFSKGCPGDVDEDSVLSAEPIVHTTNKNFVVHGKIALYPLGQEDYMDHIAHVVKLAISRKLYDQTSHYATTLKGDVHDIFTYLEDVMKYAEQNTNHYVLQVSLSINSPSLK